MKQFLVVFFIFIYFCASAQQQCKLKGKIVNEKDEPIPFATIYVPGNSASAMANGEGDFFLSLACGTYNLKVQCLGYQTKSLRIEINETQSERIFTLKTTTYQLDEVSIDPSAEDPAYPIIRRAIVMAQFYKKQIAAYETDIYIRSFYNMDDLPGLVKKMADEDELAEMQTGDIDETLLHYSYTKPNTVKEKIIARKSGSNDTSKTGSSYVNLNFYNLGGSDIINPLSRNSFKVYTFEYINTFFEEGRKVHKIEIIPKRKGGDLMSGFLYINDGLWSLNNVDVVLDQPLFNVKYQQRYNEIKPLLWMPTNHKIQIKAGALGFKVQMQYLANLSNLIVQTDSTIDSKIKANLKNYIDDFETDESIKAIKKDSGVQLSKLDSKIEELIYKEELNNRETLKLVRLIKKQEQEENVKSDTGKTFELKRNYELEYADSAFTLSDSAWKTKRIIPLTEKESKIYTARDSLTKVQNGDTTYKSNKSIWNKIVFGNKNIMSKNKHHIFQPKGLLVGFIPLFNTVDGFLPEKELFRYEWTNNTGKFIEVTPIASYAVARKTFMGRLELSSQYNKEKRGTISFTAGRRSVGFNRDEALSDRLNTISTTFFTNNFKKLFQQDYVSLSHSIDVVNGLVLGTTIEYADRVELKNNSDYELFSILDHGFKPNIPINKEVFNQPNIIENNKAFTFIANLEYTPQQFYTFRNNKKVLLNSKYPTFGLGYRKGIEGVLESQSNYDVAHLSIQQKFSYHLIDQLSYFVEAGKFFSTKKIYFADYQNFNTTPSFVIDNTKPNGFRLLDYYAFNTTNYYIEGHFSITNDHILLKYLPILNRSSVDEKLEFSYLYTDRNIHFYETGLSLTNIFFLIDGGAFVSFRNDRFYSFGIKLSFYFFN